MTSHTNNGAGSDAPAGTNDPARGERPGPSLPSNRPPPSSRHLGFFNGPAEQCPVCKDWVRNVETPTICEDCFYCDHPGCFVEATRIRDDGGRWCAAHDVVKAGAS